MRLLLDTCTFLWFTANTNLVSRHAFDTISDADTVYLSSVSVAELAIKYKKGKLELPGDISPWISQQREKHLIEALPLDEAAATRLGKLLGIHKDPLDRLLICQAQHHDLILVTPDEEIQKYEVKTLW